MNNQLSELMLRVQKHIDEDELIKLVKNLIKIPSYQDKETKLARFIGKYMEENEIEVDMREVEPGRFQRPR